MTENVRPRRNGARDPGRVIDRLIIRLWQTISELEDLTPPQTRFFRVAIFGSARVKPGDEIYEAVRSFARRVGELGCDIVTGGGPGLMAAANEGAREAVRVGRSRIRSYGLTIQLPAEERANPFVDRVTNHRTFFSRLHHFARMSHAYVVFPGGIGTSLETFMIWQLLQVGHIPDRPLVFVGDMYHGLVEWMRREMETANLVDPEDIARAIVVSLSDIDRAADVIAKAKAEFDTRTEESPADPTAAVEDEDGIESPEPRPQSTG